MTKPSCSKTSGWRSASALAAILLSLAFPSFATTGGGHGGGPTTGKNMHGTLVASDGKHIYDWQLDKLIDQHIGNRYLSKVLCFTECYGGDKVDDFAADRNTTILTAGKPGEQTAYGGYHRGLANALKPGATTATAHQAGVAHHFLTETPTSTGPVQDIGVGGAGGAIQSCHVLVWAGLPEPLDWADIRDIRRNFAGQPNTTVTVLAGDGSGADGASTFDDLVKALRDIGAMMNPNEQFILYVTDHGNLDASSEDLHVDDAPFGLILNLNPNLHQDMLDDVANDPYLAVFTAPGAPPIAAGTLTLTFNGTGPYTVGTNVQEIPLDYDADGVADQYEYLIPLAESTILSGDNQISLVNTSGAPLDLEYVSLDSGAIRRLDGPLPAP